MTTLEEEIDRHMYAAQVTAGRAIYDLEKSGSLTEEMRIKLRQVISAAQDVVNLLRGLKAHETRHW